MTRKSAVRIGLAMFAVPALFGLAACAGTGTTAATAQPVDTDMTATLELWTSDPKDPEEQIATFNQLYPNVTVNLTVVPEAQFATKIIASATTRKGPDVIWFNGAYTKNFAEAGVLADLDPYWSDYADAEQFPDSVISTHDGKKYSVQTYVNLNALWYNKAILAETGLEPPKTMGEFEDAMAKATAVGYIGLQLSGAPGVGGEWMSKPFFAAYGMKDFQDYGDGATEDMFRTLTEWTDKGYVPKATVGQSQTDQVGAFLEGKSAFYVGGNWQLSQAQESRVDFGVVGMPSGDEGSGTVYLGGQAEALGAFSSHPELAWTFLETTWLTKEFEQASLAKGSIPVRADSIPHDVDENIAAYADAVKTGVALSPDTEATLAVGDLWSGVLAGQISPSEAQQQAEKIASGAQ